MPKQTLTSQYPFDAMTVGSVFTVYSRFQHARVAASEYGRKHGCVFTCRMQDDGSMQVHRVSNDQANVDQRGRRSNRRLAHATNDPTREQFMQWIGSFEIGQSYTMPIAYTHLYSAMTAWCEVYSLRINRSIVATLLPDMTLLIQRVT